jgi:hypothetical protein
MGLIVTSSSSFYQTTGPMGLFINIMAYKKIKPQRGGSLVFPLCHQDTKSYTELHREITTQGTLSPQSNLCLSAFICGLPAFRFSGTFRAVSCVFVASC